jgi:DNA-binding response OmpR family regulator
VLFVPGDIVTGELNESFLDRRSMAVRTAGNADEALLMADAWQPSLVVMRSDLTGQRVSDFCSRLRALRPSQKPKMILLTEKLDGDLDDAADAGCDCHLISPVETNQLLDTIAALLELAQRRAPRASLDTLVHTSGFSDLDARTDAAFANCINISEDGMLIEHNRQLQVRSEGDLQFFLPSAGERLSLHGVVHLVVDEIRLHYAIEFTGLAPEQRSLLRDYVAEFNA